MHTHTHSLTTHAHHSRRHIHTLSPRVTTRANPKCTCLHGDMPTHGHTCALTRVSTHTLVHTHAHMLTHMQRALANVHRYTTSSQHLKMCTHMHARHTREHLWSHTLTHTHFHLLTPTHSYSLAHLGPPTFPSIHGTGALTPACPCTRSHLHTYVHTPRSPGPRTPAVQG